MTDLKYIKSMSLKRTYISEALITLNTPNNIYNYFVKEISHKTESLHLHESKCVKQTLKIKYVLSFQNKHTVSK